MWINASFVRQIFLNLIIMLISHFFPEIFIRYWSYLKKLCNNSCAYSILRYTLTCAPPYARDVLKK